jgi:tetratricopeptide (TPR) repeat protein
MSSRVPREKAVFCEAVEITDLEQRRQFLDQACGADKELRAQVEGLLALSQGSGDFFKECAPALKAQPSDADHVLSAVEAALGTEAPETKAIGRYKLLQRLGEGGCGVVYMAEQEEPIRRRVALKIIKLGMDTRNVIARFEAERQALALMDHPNIARVLDAGATETGRPYFVMELVYGVKITDYCDQNRISMPERLELFIQVCNAVQHAHQKGIIHRDLKPSNIMVTMHDGVPVPKVIDFGIAKATEQRLTDKTLFTSYAQLMGTPAYMSPEQMELSGLNLDTRSDIYSLGVLLYELLTGRTPFDTMDLLKLGVEELRRTICERDPLRPSAKLQTLNNEELTKTARRRHIEAPRLLSQLRGDLDWIVLKCLEKDRTRRYPTAIGLSEDIGRYLHEETVLARPPGQLYRLQKLVRRNRVVFLAGAVAAAALLLGTIISTVMFVNERKARASEARLRKEAEVREEASHIASLVTQRRFEEADKLLAGIPLNQPSVEVAAELRALGDWHATKGRWQQAAERFGSLVKVNQFDGSDVTSLDQLRLAAALLEAGDRRTYERWRQNMAARLTPADSPLPSSLKKACLLLPAGSELLERLAAASETSTTAFDNAAGIRTRAGQGLPSSDAKVLLLYRRGEFADARGAKFLADSAPRLATFFMIQAMATWRLKDYWGAMVNWTKAYALVQAGARQRLATVTVRSEIFPGMSELDDLQAPWYDWAVASLLLREWDEMMAEAEQSVTKTASRAPGLEDLAIVRAAGECHALRGEWAQALACSQYCRQSNQKDSLDHATMDYLNAAIACLELGDEKTYLRLREEMATRFEHVDEVAPWRTLEVGLVRPIDDRVSAIFTNFAAGMAYWSRNETNDYWGLMLLSLHSYRHGDYASAVDLAHQSLSRIRDGARLPEVELGTILALSQHQLGNKSAALLELDRAESMVRTSFNVDYDVWHWRHWILVRFLLQEARGLIPEAPSPQSSNAPR